MEHSYERVSQEQSENDGLRDFSPTTYGTQHQQSEQKLFENTKVTPASFYSSYVNLINSVVGSGILGLPVAFAATGWIFGYVMICVAGLCSAFSLHLLVMCAKKVKHTASFDSVTELAFPGYGYVVDMTVACLCFGNATSFLIVSSKLMPEVMEYFGVTGMWTSRQLWVVVGVALVGPLSCFKSLDALKFTNSLALGSVLFIAALVFAYSMDIGLDPCLGIDNDNLEGECYGETQFDTFSSGAVKYLGVFVFAYTCQMVRWHNIYLYRSSHL